MAACQAAAAAAAASVAGSGAVYFLGPGGGSAADDDCDLWHLLLSPLHHFVLCEKSWRADVEPHEEGGHLHTYVACSSTLTYVACMLHVVACSCMLHVCCM